MTQKDGMIQELGEEELLLPVRVNVALAANDRVKYLLTLLQTAIARANHPASGFSSLQSEREASGERNQAFDGVVGNAVRVGEDRYQIPHSGIIFASIRVAVAEMMVPFTLATIEEGEVFEERFRQIVSGLPSNEDEAVSKDLIGKITSGDRDRGDSLHILVMDLHRALNRLQGDLAQERLDGAMSYMLNDDDHEPVLAFMAGLNRTAPLKFDHTGLGTTATRTGTTLVIQNDIGETDAHILVVKVEDNTVTVIYTDVHMPRLQFFQGLFAKKSVQWTDTVSRRDSGGGEVYHLATGVYRASRRSDLLSFLSFLGSRIVFLIDWNRARKRMRNFLLNKDAIVVLNWAAEEEVGHMAFLKLGGEKIIYEALDIASQVPLRYGEPLHQILGRDKTVEFLKWALRTATEGLLHNHSRFLIQDEIKAELLRYFRSAHEGLMEYCEEHAILTIEVATAARDMLLAIRHPDEAIELTREAARAKRWESDADALVTRVRTLSRRIEAAEFYAYLINTADDALDSLEEACFLETLLSPNQTYHAVIDSFVRLGEITLAGCREYLKALIAAQYLFKGYGREDMHDFLMAVDRVITLEREADEARREALRTVLRNQEEFQTLLVYHELARSLEEATNFLRRTVYVLHDRILEGEAR
ncbi:MAG: hypothetical protein NT074_07880 [Methanomicrobiales archaeon]|nr:hypothetical protein [Methanomicrobiales archaeon]